MGKIKLNISGNLVRVALPSAIIFDEAVKQLREVTIKNYKLLKTLKFYELLETDFSSREILELEKIIKTTLNLKSVNDLNNKLQENEKEKKTARFSKFKLHYGSLKSGEKLVSDSNLIILGDTNVGSYVKSKKSIFIYGKASGTIHAGSEGSVDENRMIYIKEMGNSKIRIGNEFLVYNYIEKDEHFKFIKKQGKIIVKKLKKSEINELLREIGFDLI